jgi:hypothetical protein
VKKKVEGIFRYRRVKIREIPGLLGLLGLGAGPGLGLGTQTRSQASLTITSPVPGPSPSPFRSLLLRSRRRRAVGIARVSKEASSVVRAGPGDATDEQALHVGAAEVNVGVAGDEDEGALGAQAFS